MSLYFQCCSSFPTDFCQIFSYIFILVENFNIFLYLWNTLRFFCTCGILSYISILVEHFHILLYLRGKLSYISILVEYFHIFLYLWKTFMYFYTCVEYFHVFLYLCGILTLGSGAIILDPLLYLQTGFVERLGQQICQPIIAGW